jgi:hypothetical protein
VFHLGVVFGSAAATQHHRLERAMPTPIVCSDLSFIWVAVVML